MEFCICSYLLYYIRLISFISFVCLFHDDYEDDYDYDYDDYDYDDYDEYDFDSSLNIRT
ncbi:MAG: hypothetical protein K6F97_08985 [Lachnospiraceae bacterium]|nr:hypothetical protein [Lachnospiraceae bacterium]